MKLKVTIRVLQNVRLAKKLYFNYHKSNFCSVLFSCYVPCGLLRKICVLYIYFILGIKLLTSNQRRTIRHKPISKSNFVHWFHTVSAFTCMLNLDYSSITAIKKNNSNVMLMEIGINLSFLTQTTARDYATGACKGHSRSWTPPHAFPLQADSHNPIPQHVIHIWGIVKSY